MKENKVYIMRTLILVLFLIPLVLSLLTGLAVFKGMLFLIICEIVLLLMPGYFYARKIKLPENAAIRYLPMFMSLMYTSILWIITMFVSKGVYDSNLFNIFIISHFQYISFTTLFKLILLAMYAFLVNFKSSISVYVPTSNEHPHLYP